MQHVNPTTFNIPCCRCSGDLATQWFCEHVLRRTSCLSSRKADVNLEVSRVFPMGPPWLWAVILDFRRTGDDRTSLKNQLWNSDREMTDDWFHGELIESLVSRGDGRSLIHLRVVVVGMENLDDDCML